MLQRYDGGSEAEHQRKFCTDSRNSDYWTDYDYCVQMWISFAVSFVGGVLLVCIGMMVRQRVIRRYQIQETGELLDLGMVWTIPEPM